MTFLQNFISSHALGFQILLSVTLALLGIGLNALLARLIQKRYEDPRDPSLLSTLISTRNTIGAVCSVLIFVLWAGEIKHGLISVAALMAAMILASKEMWSNFFGMVTRTLVRPFTVGDVIEIGSIRGKVVDMDSFTIRVLVQGGAGQTTGRIAEIPNSVLLTQPVINMSLAGEYSSQFTQVNIPLDSLDVIKSSAFLKQCADEVCEPFIADATGWLENRAKELHLDLPGAKPYVLVSPKDYRQVDLILRFPCPRGQRVKIEQLILNRFYQGFESLKKAPAKADDTP